ncbi:PREDICTED: vicilin-like seed storage protein At2g18540 [Nicrophorus vespilloides]|uniref:Vicilin-like seed storage protein At2g18540 n=1 Tax=Nicrophorus vespilloides TaxID=110193 RepID=A0ABM1NGK4_NICVS|nr:PREDICTED: vicilin-like seed storage protein At2g18540 [Nicrophorus vespilloides]
MSEQKMLKRIGERMAPCRTPALIMKGVEEALSILIDMDLLRRKLCRNLAQFIANIRWSNNNSQILKMYIHKEVRSIQGRIEEYVDGENRNYLQDVAMVRQLQMLNNIVLNQNGKIVAETVKFVDELCEKTYGIIQKTAFEVLRELVFKKEGFNNIRERIKRQHEEKMRETLNIMKQKQKQSDVQMKTKQEKSETEKELDTKKVQKEKEVKKHSDVQINTKEDKSEREKQLDIQIANMRKVQKEREEKARAAKNEEKKRKRKRIEEEDILTEEEARQIEEMLSQTEEKVISKRKKSKKAKELADLALQIEQNLFNT